MLWYTNMKSPIFVTNSSRDRSHTKIRNSSKPLSMGFSCARMTAVVTNSDRDRSHTKIRNSSKPLSNGLAPCARMDTSVPCAFLGWGLCPQTPVRGSAPKIPLRACCPPTPCFLVAYTKYFFGKMTIRENIFGNLIFRENIFGKMIFGPLRGPRDASISYQSSSKMQKFLLEGVM